MTVQYSIVLMCCNLYILIQFSTTCNTCIPSLCQKQEPQTVHCLVSNKSRAEGNTLQGEQFGDEVGVSLCILLVSRSHLWMKQSISEPHIWSTSLRSLRQVPSRCHGPDFQCRGLLKPGPCSNNEDGKEGINDCMTHMRSIQKKSCFFWRTDLLFL